MTPPSKTISAVADFESVSHTTWRQRVSEELGGQDPDSTLGVELPGGLRGRPLYTQEESIAAERVLPSPNLQQADVPVVRPWRIAAEVKVTDRALAGSIIHNALAHGADLLWIGPACFEDLGGLLAGVDLERIALVLDSGAEVSVAAAQWNALSCDVDPQTLVGGFGCDPLGTLAAAGYLKAPLEVAWRGLGVAAAQCAVKTPGMRAALVSSVPYHEAGVTTTDELACALAGGMETLRQLTAAGLDIDRAACQLMFTMAVGNNIFLEIAKLRAVRLLWAKVVSASGGGLEAQRMRIHARTSGTTWAARAPWLNLLRGGLEGFSAAVAGVWSLEIQPFDTALGLPVATSRRLAVSTQHMLAEESHLGRVVDPAAGSYYVEDLTVQLARAAWERCREIEDFGGLSQALLQGKIQAWARDNAGQRNSAVAHRREVMVGVSDFAYVGEKTPVREALPTVDVSNLDVPETSPANAVELPVPFVWQRYGQGFENLRQMAERWQDQHGRGPRVGLLGLGSPKEHSPRTNFARGFFASGGVEAIPLESAEAFDPGDLDGVVLCGTDEQYSAEAASLIATLRQRKVSWVFLAGKPRPGDEAITSEAGVDACVFRGVDVLKILAAFLSDLGASS
jgi:methylmalonyl-CoA mutase